MDALVVHRELAQEGPVVHLLLVGADGKLAQKRGEKGAALAREGLEVHAQRLCRVAPGLLHVGLRRLLACCPLLGSVLLGGGVPACVVVLMEKVSPRPAIVGMRATTKQMVEALRGQAVAQLRGKPANDLVALGSVARKGSACLGQKLVGKRVGHDIGGEVPGGAVDRLAHEGVQQDAVGEGVRVGMRRDLAGAGEVAEQQAWVYIK